MYAGYAWLTNAVSPDRGSRRALLLGGMAAFLVLALAIPHAFGDSAIAFGIAYAVVVAVHAALYSRTDSEATVRSVAGLERFNAVGVMLVLVGGVIGGPAQYALWAAAFAWEWITPRLIDDSGFLIGAAHLVERHGLVVIVAIGESVVAIGIGASGRPVDLPLALVSVLGLLLSACLWWSYFDGDDAEAERALAEAPQARRPRLAVDAFGLWHLPLLGGIVAIAAALREATGARLRDRRHGRGADPGRRRHGVPARGRGLPGHAEPRGAALAAAGRRAGAGDHPARPGGGGGGPGRRAGGGPGRVAGGRAGGGQRGARDFAGSMSHSRPGGVWPQT